MNDYVVSFCIPILYKYKYVYSIKYNNNSLIHQSLTYSSHTFKRYLAFDNGICYFHLKHKFILLYMYLSLFLLFEIIHHLHESALLNSLE